MIKIVVVFVLFLLVVAGVSIPIYCLIEDFKEE